MVERKGRDRRKSRWTSHQRSKKSTSCLEKGESGEGGTEGLRKGRKGRRRISSVRRSKGIRNMLLRQRGSSGQPRGGTGGRPETGDRTGVRCVASSALRCAALRCFAFALPLLYVAGGRAAEAAATAHNQARTAQAAHSCMAVPERFGGRRLFLRVCSGTNERS